MPLPTRLRRALLLEAGEGPLLGAAMAGFGLALGSFYLLRPLREAAGIAGGADKLPLLTLGVLLATGLANPLYAWLAARFPRRRFVPITYRAFQVQLLLLFGAFRAFLGSAALSYAFYIWLSVFNVFVVAVCWSVLTDLFSEDQGRRLFGPVSMAGTLVAAGAAWVAGRAAASAGGAQLPLLFLLAALCLEGAWQALRRLAARTGWKGRGTGLEPGPRPSEGLRLIARKPYLQAMAAYQALFCVASQVIYILQGEVVSRLSADPAQRTAIFARLDLWTSLSTFGFQAFLTGRLLRGRGLQAALVAYPAFSAAACLLLGWKAGFAVLAVVMVAHRTLQYGLDGPAREVLYIPLGQDEKYKTQAFISTFVYRSGDLTGAWLPRLLGLGGTSFGTAASLLWLASGAWLGRLRERL